MPSPGGPIPNEYMQQMIQLLATGVLNEFITRMPPGIFIDPRTPVVVTRFDNDGNKVNVATNMIQQIAELNDNIKDLNDLMEQELKAAKRMSRRRD